MNSLLIFTLGPVQSFLAQARKARDLYASSFLLSHLCQVAAEKATKYGAEIIYPYLAAGSIPNRFVAVLPSGGEEELKRVGADLERAVRQELRSLGQEVLVASQTNLTSALQEAFYRQLDNLLEVYWVAVPDIGEDYVGAYREARDCLEAIKATRPFLPLNERGRKCSLSGEHNALFFRGRRKAFLDPVAQRVSNHLPMRYLAEGECLSGPGFLKRCLDQTSAYRQGRTNDLSESFPSTATVAVMDTVERLPQGKVARYRQIFGADFDGSFFYEDNLAPQVLKREGVSLDRLEPAREALRELVSEAKKAGLRFTRYYGILCMDGDNMGQWVDGHFLADVSQLLSFQRSLTRQLGLYASEVQRIIQYPRGCLVYWGGDDLLALVNLNHLLSVMEELRKHFPHLEELPGVKKGNRSSSSCGVCVAHYKVPVAEVLHWARSMESRAKETDGKDAFALAVLKHTGEIQQVVYKWDYDGLRPLALLQNLVQLLATGDFSDTFIRNLSHEFRVLVWPPGVPREEPLLRNGFTASEEQMLEAEVGRLLRRACQHDQRKHQDTIADLQQKLINLYIQSTLEDFLSFLEIAAFLAREVNTKPCT